jgi:hypothetical protein
MRNSQPILKEHVPAPDTECVYRDVPIKGNMPSPINLPAGCMFHFAYETYKHGQDALATAEAAASSKAGDAASVKEDGDA